MHEQPQPQGLVEEEKDALDQHQENEFENNISVPYLDLEPTSQEKDEETKNEPTEDIGVQYVDLPAPRVSKEPEAVTDVPESGLMKPTDLAHYLNNVTNITELNENLATRLEAIVEYTKLLQTAESGTARRGAIQKELSEQLGAKQIILARIDAVKAVEAENQRILESQKPEKKSWFKKLFGRK